MRPGSAAVGGTQPPLSRQRAAVRVRRGGPGGPVVGIEKIAIGNGNYTGDASWGVFGAAFAPGEVPLEPGETYAVELESIETRETLHGFVNIKGQVSDERPGFNPYRKCPPDEYPRGAAIAEGCEAMDFDLDFQILEYEHAASDWAFAVESENLLPQGAWKELAIEPGSVQLLSVEEPGGKNHFLRVAESRTGSKTADGGFLQRVDGLSRAETYRLSGRVRSSWPVDADHQSLVGHDPTGQTEDPRASSISWTVLPAVHGIFVPYRSPPIRPSGKAISVWLRGRVTASADAQIPFQADFDGFVLQRVRTDAPGPARAAR